jgi:hypothetical protein
MATKKSEKHPADKFIVLRPIPSKKWKAVVKRAARHKGISQGQYLIEAITSRLTADGYGAMLEPPKVEPTPAE